MFSFNWAVSITDIISLITVLAAFLAVYFQARSTRLAEKDLQIKVHDIEELIQKIETERNERIKQIDVRIDKELELINYTNHVYAETQKIQRDSDKIVRDQLGMIAAALWSLSRLHRLDEDTQVIEAVSEACAATLGMIAVGEVWDAELTAASERSETRRKNILTNISLSEYTDLIRAENERLETDIADVTKRMSARLIEPSKQYNTAKSRIIELLSTKIAGAAPVSAPPPPPA